MMVVKAPFFTEHLCQLLSENNEQQQLSKGFGNSCYSVVSPILPQELINNFAICKPCSKTLSLVENVTSSHGFGN